MIPILGWPRGGGVRTGFLAPILPALALVACSPRVQNPFQGSTGRNRGDPTQRHLIRFEASCDYCAVSWNVQAQSGSESNRGLWSQNVYVYVDPGGTQASLRATPSQGSAPVRWVRIRVDGEIVAEERNDRDVGEVDRSLNRTLTISAPIAGGESPPTSPSEG